MLTIPLRRDRGKSHCTHWKVMGFKESLDFISLWSSLLLGLLFNCSLTKVASNLCSESPDYAETWEYSWSIESWHYVGVIPFLALPHLILSSPSRVLRRLALPWPLYSGYPEHLVLFKWSYELLNYLKNKQNLCKLSLCLFLIEICMACFIWSIMKYSDFHRLWSTVLWAIDTFLKNVKIQNFINWIMW